VVSTEPVNYQRASVIILSPKLCAGLTDGS
jgi:hypothetical protein